MAPIFPQNDFPLCIINFKKNNKKKTPSLPPSSLSLNASYFISCPRTLPFYDDGGVSVAVTFACRVSLFVCDFEIPAHRNGELAGKLRHQLNG